MFLAITAEEESATALFHTLHRRGYSGSKKLKIKNHLQNTALHPFLLAVGKLFAESFSNCSARFELDTNNVSDLLRIKLTVTGAADKISHEYPSPPLNFTVLVNEIACQFEPQFSILANEKNAITIYEYVEKLANRRNLALYASPKGIPHVDGGAGEFLLYRKSVIFTHFLAILLIDPYPQKQKFVQQALAAFLNMLKLLPDEKIEV